ncbi:hypothetical protein IHQ68_18035 [Chelatococcus sambhunathii]|uniref:DUF1795 domain-containing protein n=1 Tax=Chelatococcus sambhunathii TaxID=363953 RepID=A0ABU1DK63_9HYPH|nr:hypothetical protein [Chelatococcus sambhunathii]MDR4308523.1 hypothetical protein [Chelatococcus sambhunathii]
MISRGALAFGAALVSSAPFCMPVRAQTAVVDYLGLPGPYALRDVEYRLAWSSQPTPGYAKHEYLPVGQSPERFERMILIEHAAGVDPVKAAAAKVEELKARKPNDPTTNWTIARNGAAGEILLDFTLSAPDAAGGGISEWNAYRYAAAPGGRGVVLLGFSRRAYGVDRTAFYQALKAERRADLAAFTALPMVLVRPKAR